MGDSRGRRGSALPVQAPYPAIGTGPSRGGPMFVSPGDSENEDIERGSEADAGGARRIRGGGGGGGGGRSRSRERPGYDRREGSRAVRDNSRGRSRSRQGADSSSGQSAGQLRSSSASSRDLAGGSSTGRKPNGAGVGGRDRDELNGGARRGSKGGSADLSGWGPVGEDSSSRSLGGARTGGGSGAIQGLEPAMKSHGCMTAATAMKLITLAVALLNVAILWSRDYDKRRGGLCLGGRRRRCVDSAAEMALITLAKLTAGALYPSIVCSIISKCYATRYFLHNSWLALIVDLEPAHKLHTYFGLVALLCSVVHGACHVTLSALQRRPGFLLETSVNRSGLAALLLLLAVGMPMSLGFIREKLTYEVRKTLHLLTIPFMIALCFHGKPLRLLGAVLLVWYLLDRLYFTTKMTFLIASPTFKPVGRGTLVRFELPAGYQYKAGAYIQVNCPAISASEWHPFSLFPVPGSRPRAGFHVEAVGDWTNAMFTLCLENPRMQLWITAAQPSVLEQAVYYDNVVLVCTGAGITPAVSVAERFSKEKNLHLLWMCRDAGMVAMFEKQLRRVRSTVYLTGKQTNKTRRRVVDLLAPQREDVVAATAAGLRAPCHKPGIMSLGNLADLEAGGGGTETDASLFPANLDHFRGLLRDNDDAGRTAMGADDDDESEMSSALGGSMWGGGSSLAGGSALGARPSQGASGGTEAGTLPGGKNNHRRRAPTGQSQLARRYHPVAVNFGRPDIEEFVTETIEGTAVVAQWAPPADSRVPPTPPQRRAPVAEGGRPSSVRSLRQMLTRLNTGQRISKRDLMEADLSVVDAHPSKPSSISGATGFQGPDPSGERPRRDVDKGSWLVLYCGANANVEQAVANASDRLEVTWRKEYFNKW